MTDQSLAILSSLYGHRASSGDGGNPVASLNRAERTQSKQIADEAKQPEVARAISRFTKAVANAKDPASLLKNPDVLEVLLTANGLGTQAAYPALAQKALLSDPSDPKSLASRLPNANWKQAARTYDFARQGLNVLRQPDVLQAIARGYAEVKWRESLDASTPGLSKALTFIDKASAATTVDAILGDATLRSVVTKALGIPAQIAYQSLDTQERAVSARLDVTRLQDPKFVRTMAKQYLVQLQLENAQGGSSSLEQLAVRSIGLVA